MDAGGRYDGLFTVSIYTALFKRQPPQTYRKVGITRSSTTKHPAQSYKTNGLQCDDVLVLVCTSTSVSLLFGQRSECIMPGIPEKEHVPP